MLEQKKFIDEITKGSYLENERPRILLAEDEEDLNLITRMILERSGYDVVSTFNGKTALNLYNDTFQIVVTDIVMPEMGGRELILELRKINPKVKCIAITGHTDSEIPEGVPVLYKPVSLAKLLETLKEVSERLETSEITIKGD